MAWLLLLVDCRNNQLNLLLCSNLQVASPSAKPPGGYQFFQEEDRKTADPGTE